MTQEIIRQSDNTRSIHNIYDESASVIPVQRDYTEMLDRYIKYIDSTPKTIETYTKALRQFGYYLRENGVRYPDRETVISYRESLKENHKPTTVQNYITALRLFFKWTEETGLYPNIANHVKGAKLSREHKKDYFTADQVKDLLASIDRSTEQGSRDYAIMLLMITGGLRTVEVSRANIEDIKLTAGNVVLYVQGKGRSEKAEYIKLSAITERAIRKYLSFRGSPSVSEPLFTSTSNNNRGARMTTRSISAIAKNIMTGAGFNSDRLTAHSLRHTAVTLSLLAGESLEEVKQFARHSNISTTLIYNHAIDESKNNCSEAISALIG